MAFTHLHLHTTYSLLDDLIANKRASGRPKDLADAMTLEKLKEKKNG